MLHEPFNILVKSGQVAEVIGRILETIRPEMAYFTELEGQRGALFVVNVQSTSDIPTLAEPFFS